MDADKNPETREKVVEREQMNSVPEEALASALFIRG
jgi:hypothetical protein